MNPIHRMAATAVASTALLMSTGLAASAQSVSMKDKSSDVVELSSDDLDGNGEVLGYQDSLDSGADVRSMKVKHTKKSLSVTLKFAELKRDTSITVAIKVPGKSEPRWFVSGVSPSKAEVFTPKGKSVCSARQTVKTGSGGSIKVVVKRSCLDDAKKLKIAAAAGTVEFEGADKFIVKQDAVSPNAIRTPSYTKWLKAS